MYNSIYKGLGFPGLLQYGGQTHGPSIAGEAGTEWVVPTYEPERSNFLAQVGADPEKIANKILERIGGGQGNTTKVYFDGVALASLMEKQVGSHSGLTRALDRRYGRRS